MSTLWGWRRLVYVAAATFAGLALPAAAVAQSTQDYDPRIMLSQVVAESWFTIDKFQGSLSPVPDRDTFLLQGSMNIDPSLLGGPMDVTLTLDQWSVTLPAAGWTKVGTTEHYKTTVGNVRGDITYAVNGSSRCKYKFTGTRQDLQNNVTNYPYVPVEIAVGMVLDEAIVAEVRLNGRGYKMIAAGPDPAMMIDAVQFNVNLGRVDRDRVLLVGRIWSDAEFDPSTDSISGDIGPVHFEIPPGTLVLRDGPSVNRVPLGGGTVLTLKVAPNTAKFSIMITNVDASTVTPDTVVTLVFAGDAAWSFALTLQQNRPGTMLKW